MQKKSNKNIFNYPNNLTVIYEIVSNNQNDESETPSCLTDPLLLNIRNFFTHIQIFLHYEAYISNTSK